MSPDLQKRIAEALQNPQNMGELANADAVGTVGNSDCGEMLRLWVKFKEQNGKKVIDRATYREPSMPSVGIEHVIVNGVSVVLNAQGVEGVTPGQHVRAPFE
jgi:N-acyl-D-aspartate/D-glutamate deacylase